MSKKQKTTKQRQFGKTSQPTGKDTEDQKKSLLHPKHRSTIWTIVIVIILIIFFIINNTRETPAEGPYPPNYNPEKMDGNNGP